MRIRYDDSFVTSANMTLRSFTSFKTMINLGIIARSAFASNQKVFKIMITD